MSELATGYVNILPSTKNMGRELLKLLDTSDTTAPVTKGGEKLGKRLMGGMSSAVKVGAAGLAAGVVAGIAGMAGHGLKEFSALESGMNEVFTLLPGSSQEAMGAMTKDVRKFSQEMGVVHSEAVPALYSALSAGIPKDNVFEFLKTANKAAVGGVSDLDTAVSAISGPVNAYGEEVLSADQASDAMFTAIKNGVTTFPELASTMANVTPVAASLGVNFGDVTGAIATMTAQGTPTAQAVTGIRAALLELSKDGTKTSDAFKEITGKSFADFIAEGGNVQEALALLGEDAANSGLAVNDMFGSVEAGTAALQLTGKNADKYAEQITAANDAMASGGAVTTAAFETMDRGLSRSWQRIKIGITDAAIGFATTLAPAVALGADLLVDKFIPALASGGELLSNTIGPVLSEVAGGVRAFMAAWHYNDGDVTSAGFAGELEKLGYAARQLYGNLRDRLTPAFEFFASVIKGGVIPVVASLGKWLYDNRDLVKSVVIVVGTMVAAWKVAALATAGYTAAAAKLALAVKVIKGLRNIVVLTRGAVIALNVAMRANVVGIIVTAIAGLVAGLILAYRNIGWFKDAVDAAWSGIVTATQWLGDAIAAAWSGIKDAAAAVAEWWTGTLVPAIRTGVDGIVTGFRWLKGIASAVFTGIKLVLAIAVGLWLGLFTLVVRALRTVLAPAFEFLRDKVVRPVMDGIRSTIAGLSAWWTGTAVPGIKAGIALVAAGFMWWHDRVVRPVVDLIRNALDALRLWWVRIVVPAFERALAVLGAAFRYLSERVVAPVVDAVRRVLDALRTWFDRIFVAGVKAGLGLLGDAFKWLRDRVVRPVWDGIRDILGRGWDWIKSRVFDPLVKFTRETIPDAFAKAKDAVGEQWRKLKGIVSEPVGWVIDHVINDPLIASINSVLENVGLTSKKITPISSGFFHGGRTGGTSPYEERGVVHGKEFVLTAERTAELDRMAPGLLDNVHRHGAKALAGLNNPADMAPGDLVYGGTPSFSGAHQQAIARSGRLNVAGSAPGWGLDQAISMLDRATTIKVARGPAGGANGLTAHANHYAWDKWAGYYQGGARKIHLNNATMGHASPVAKRTVTVHEIGHALGLPHSALKHGGNGAPSIMNYDNMFAHNSVTAADVAALSRIYSGTGTPSAGEGTDGPNVPGVIARLIEPILGFVGKIGDKITAKFPGGGTALDMVKGSAKLVGDGVKGWLGDTLGNAKDLILEKLGGVKDWIGGQVGKLKGLLGGSAASARPSLYDNGGLIHRGVQLIDHQRSAPDKVLTDSQWQTMASIAKAAASGITPSRDEDRATVHVTVPEREGMAPDHLGQRVGESAAWALTKAGI